MAAVSFTRAEVERAVSATRAAGVAVSEVRIEKTAKGAVIRILSGTLSAPAESGNDGPQLEDW